MTHDNDFADDATSYASDIRADRHRSVAAQNHQDETPLQKDSELGKISSTGTSPELDSSPKPGTSPNPHPSPDPGTSPNPHALPEPGTLLIPDAPSPYECITAHNISIGFPHTTEEGWRMGVEAKEKFRLSPSSPLRVEMWWPFDRPDPTEQDIARLSNFLTSNNLQLIAMNLWAGNMAAGERGVLHREPLPSSHIDAVARIHELTGVQKFNLLVGRRGEDADPWEVQRERFARAAIQVHLATGGMVLVENMSGIEDYPVKRVREAFELIDEVYRVLRDFGLADYGLDPNDEDLVEDVASNSSGVLFDAYHFLTNWEAKIENNDPWVVCPGDVIEMDGLNEAGEGRTEEGDDDDAEFEAHCPTQQVGGDQIWNLLECQNGCMVFWRHFSHVQVAAWPDRGDPMCSNDQILDIVEGIRAVTRITMDADELEIVGEWLPGS